MIFSRRYSSGVQRAIDLAPHPVVGLRLQAGHAEKFAQAPGPEKMELFLRVSKQGPCLTAIEEDGDNDRHVQPQLTGEAEGAASSGPGKSGNGCHQVLFNQSLPSGPV